MSLVQILLLALALSAAGNWWQHNQWLDQHDETLQARNTAKANGEAAKLCSDGTARLQSEARRLELEGKALRDAARKAATERQTRAQQILSTPPSDPGDDCKSAQTRATRWLEGRGKS